MVNISNIDLNLFVVLDAVLAERSVTRAAQRLHVTPPAISNSLARLRELLGDPLAVRKGRGLVPTPRAVELAPTVAAALDQIKSVVERPRGFRPDESTRTFTLAAADNQQLCEVPRIIDRFARQLPQARLRVVSPDYLQATDGLATGEIDFAFSLPPATPPGCDSMPLYDEVGTFIVRRDHPRLRGRMTPALFNAAKHIHIEVALGRTGSGGRIAEEIWRKQGLARDIALTVPHFVAAAMAAARTDLVAALPSRAARLFCGLLPLKMVTPTFEMPRATTTLVWHARTHADAGNVYVRELIARAVKAAPASRGTPARSTR